MGMELKEGFTIPILDHGYLNYIEHWGSDERIIEAARMSTGKGFLGWGPITTDKPCPNCQGYGTHLGSGPDRGNPTCEVCKGEGKEIKPGDEKLLRFLWENKHQTPFEMPGLTVEVMAPIMVFREWHRHRIPFGYNEMSARYTPLPDVNYIPSIERLMIGSDGKNRQAGTISGANALTVDNAKSFQEELKRVYIEQEAIYQKALKDGVPKELARVHLPVGRYSRMRATGNLRGWLAFCTLRMAKSAQWEIRQFSNALGGMLKVLFPRTWEIFIQGKDFETLDLEKFVK